VVDNALMKGFPKGNPFLFVGINHTAVVFRGRNRLNSGNARIDHGGAWFCSKGETIQEGCFIKIHVNSKHTLSVKGLYILIGEIKQDTVNHIFRTVNLPLKVRTYG
jgi:hypothetical protein